MLVVLVFGKEEDRADLNEHPDRYVPRRFLPSATIAAKMRKKQRMLTENATTFVGSQSDLASGTV